MELRIKPAALSRYPLRGILIKGNSINNWIKEVQRMGLSLNEVDAYAVPGDKANSIAGCLLVTKRIVSEIYSNEFFQSVYDKIFIPEKAELYPAISIDEIEDLFPGKLHFFHPEFGFYELTDKIDWQKLIAPPVLVCPRISIAAEKVFLPGTIKSFQIDPVVPHDLIKKLEDELFPKKEDDTKPLDIAEQAKLSMYKTLFGKLDAAGNMAAGGGVGLMKGMNALLGKMFGITADWTDGMQEDYRDLEKRNQNAVDRLLDLLKSDPSEALKYAIPIDGEGTSRGSHSGSFNLSKRWSNFSLGGSLGASGSSTVDIGDRMYDLQRQYENTAEELIKQNEHYKAAFIYMKLLKQYLKAAETLASGGFYAEAAAIYLNHVFDKQKAAECYEKGNITLEAIKIYKELNHNEKVGDLYLTLKKSEEAMLYFEKVVEAYTSTNQYLKASLVRKYKMNDNAGTQHLLMEGWRNDKDAFNCLNNYFNNIPEIKFLSVELTRIYKEEVTVANREVFLKVLKYEYRKQNELSESIRNIGYEIIAEHITVNPSIVNELPNFNKQDRQLMKDVFRFNAK